jgi:hypothetical protein
VIHTNAIRLGVACRYLQARKDQPMNPKLSFIDRLPWAFVSGVFAVLVLGSLSIVYGQSIPPLW